VKVFIVKASSFQTGRMQVVRQVPRRERAVADAERRLESARKALVRAREEQESVLSDLGDESLREGKP